MLIHDWDMLHLYLFDHLHKLLKSLSGVRHVRITSQHVSLLPHESNRLGSTPNIHSCHQGPVPYPLTPGYLLAIISHRHGNLLFLFCCFWTIQL